MPDLIPREQLQPALLDRLADNAPDKSAEARDRRVISPRELHESVKRDLAWLLNSPNLETTEDLEEYPEAAKSVINYGVPDFSGRSVTAEDIPAMQRALRDAILTFEPRILAKSLEVDVKIATDSMDHNTLTFVLRGELWAHPIPLELFLQTDVDLDTGNVSVIDGER
jgi:type VI secretion system protein ImpF